MRKTQNTISLNFYNALNEFSYLKVLKNYSNSKMQGYWLVIGRKLA